MYVIVGIAILPGTKKIVEHHLKSLQALQALCAVPQHDLPIFRCHGTNGQLPVLDIGGVRLTLPSKFVSVKTTSEKDSTIFNMKPFHHHWLSFVNLFSPLPADGYDSCKSTAFTVRSKWSFLEPVPSRQFQVFRCQSNGEPTISRDQTNQDT